MATRTVAAAASSDAFCTWLATWRWQRVRSSLNACLTALCRTSSTSRTGRGGPGDANSGCSSRSACRVESGVNGDVGSHWKKGRGLSVGSEVPGLSS